MKSSLHSTPGITSPHKKSNARVLMVPRRKPGEGSKANITLEQFIQTLKIPPTERTKQDIDTLITYISRWDDFSKNIRTDQMRREVCRQMILEEHKPNAILFKINAEPDGWYLVISGQCAVIYPCENDRFHADIPLSTLSILRKEFGNESFFHLVAHKGPTQEFGNTALINNNKRNATIITTEPTRLIRVDAQLYKDAAQYFKRAQLEKRAEVLSVVPEFQCIQDYPGIFQRLAENANDHRFEVDQAFDINHPATSTQESAIYVIMDGLVARRREVDFSKAVVPSGFGVDIHLPKGKRTVTVDTLGPRGVFPSPSAADFSRNAFSICVLEPTNIIEILVSNMKTILPIAQFVQIRDQIMNQPTDEGVISMWMEREKEIQWEAYKKQCVKEVRRAMKVERDILNGELGFRHSGIPKSIKPFVRGRVGRSASQPISRQSPRNGIA